MNKTRIFIIFSACVFMLSVVFSGCGKKSTPTEVIVYETVIAIETCTVTATITRTATAPATGTMTRTRTITATGSATFTATASATHSGTATVTPSLTATATATVTSTCADILVDDFEDMDLYNNIEPPMNKWLASTTNGIMGVNIIAAQSGGANGAYAISVTRNASFPSLSMIGVNTALVDKYSNSLDLSKHKYIKMNLAGIMTPAPPSGAAVIVYLSSADGKSNTVMASVTSAGFSWQVFSFPLASFTTVNMAGVTGLGIIYATMDTPGTKYALDIDTVKFTLY